MSISQWESMGYYPNKYGLLLVAHGNLRGGLRYIWKNENRKNKKYVKFNYENRFLMKIVNFSPKFLKNYM
jgi:hypothetical protein